MTFQCALVAKLQDCTVLSSAINPAHPNADLRVLSEVLSKVKGKRNNKLTMVQGGVQIHLATDDAIIIALSTAESVQKKPATVCLDEVKRQFLSMYTEPVSTLSSDMCRDYNTQLIDILKKHALQDSGSGRIRDIQTALDDVRDVMTENIDKVIERNGKIESIVERSEELDDVAQHFRRRARTVQRKMWWEDVKIKIFLAFGVVVVIVVISMIACGGPDYSGCK